MKIGTYIPGVVHQSHGPLQKSRNWLICLEIRKDEGMGYVSLMKAPRVN